MSDLATLSRQIAKPFIALARIGHLPTYCLLFSFALALCALAVFRFSAASANAELVSQPRAQILALASADFDEDGVADLISSSESDGVGLVTLTRGAVSAVYPNSLEAQRQRATGAISGGAFLSSPLAVVMPQRPDFLGAGDFDRDGHWDVIVAARGGGKLHLFSGNGKGELNLTKEIYLPGAVTALTAGEINRRDGLADFAVGIESGAGAQVLIYESPEGAINAEPEIFSFAAKVTALTAGQLDNEFNQDLAVAAGSELAIIHGRDRKLTLDQSGRSAVATARLSRYSLPSVARSIALGEFNGQPGTDIAALTEEGAVSVTTLARTKARSNAENTVRLSANVWPQATALVCARMSGQKNDDLIVVDPTQRQLNILSDLKQETTSPGKNASPKIVSLTVEGQPLTVLPMRLNADALEDLVIGVSGRSQVSVVASSPAATFTVNSTEDGGDSNPNDQRCDMGNGQCTLRAAIEESNALKTACTINFNIGNGGLQTIPIRSALPPLNVATTIDGTTQPGFSGRPLIQLNPTNVGIPNGLTLQASNCVIRGLAINNFFGSGILVLSDSNFIEGNFLGVSSDGLSTSRNTRHGIELTAGTANRIGGTVAAASNVISGNLGVGVFMLRAAVKNLVQGNLIGLNATGTVGLPNGQGGLRIESDGNILGGTVTGARNIISGNNGFGVSLGGNGVGSTVQGNYIGTDITGTARISNVSGVGIGDIDASRQNSILIGGTAAGAGNVISGNTRDGIALIRTSNNRIEGNLIGIDVSGTGNTLNGLDGVAISQSSDNVIGGTATGAGNVIAFNKLNGVSVVAGGTGNQILANSVFSNGGIGIDLNGDGVTLNDGGDADTGANNLQNFPVLNSAFSTGNSLNIQGRLDSASGAITLSFYRNDNCDVSGYGQGANFIGSSTMMTTGNGATLFSATFQIAVPVGAVITATATDQAGNTSEFSKCLQVQQPPTNILVNSLGDNPDRDLADLVCDDGSGNCTLRAAIQQANAIPGANTITFRVGIGGGTATIAPQTPLPAITDSLTIDATTQPNTSGASLIELSGVAAGNSSFSGLTINAANCIVRGLIVTRFGGNGISISGNGNLIEGNIITSNNDNGISVAAGVGNRLSKNSIYSNRNLGIDLGQNGVTQNDPGDADSGANNLQNFPIVTSAVSTGKFVRLSVNFDGGNVPYTLEFYANTTCGSSGYGEGRSFIGEITVTGSGTLTPSFQTSFSQGSFITATATDSSGNTSEFSPCKLVDADSLNPPKLNLSSIIVLSDLITATGSNFADKMEILVNGVKFSDPAKVEKEKSRVSQTGVLVDGRKIDLAIRVGIPVNITFRNSSGEETSVLFTRTPRNINQGQNRNPVYPPLVLVKVVRLGGIIKISGVLKGLPRTRYNIFFLLFLKPIDPGNCVIDDDKKKMIGSITVTTNEEGVATFGNENDEVANVTFPDPAPNQEGIVNAYAIPEGESLEEILGNGCILPGALIQEISVTSDRIVARGIAFTNQVQVFVDDIAFSQPAVVEENQRKVTQTAGPGDRSIDQAIPPGRRVRIRFLNCNDGNCNGGQTEVLFKR